MNCRIVIVDWLDTVDSSTWETKDEVQPKLVKQLGWLVSNQNGCVKLADTLSEGEYYGITAIPSGCIQLVVDLVTGEPESY